MARRPLILCRRGVALPLSISSWQFLRPRTRTDRCDSAACADAGCCANSRELTDTQHFDADNVVDPFVCV